MFSSLPEPQNPWQYFPWVFFRSMSGQLITEAQLRSELARIQLERDHAVKELQFTKSVEVHRLREQVDKLRTIKDQVLAEVAHLKRERTAVNNFPDHCAYNRNLPRCHRDPQPSQKKKSSLLLLKHLPCLLLAMLHPHRHRQRWGRHIS